MLKLILLTVAVQLTRTVEACSATTTTLSSPTVRLDFAAVHGVSDGYTNAFYGIRYAQPP